MGDCKFVNGGKHARSLDPWRETHERSASRCIAAPTPHPLDAACLALMTIGRPPVVQICEEWIQKPENRGRIEDVIKAAIERSMNEKLVATIATAISQAFEIKDR